MLTGIVGLLDETRRYSIQYDIVQLLIVRRSQLQLHLSHNNIAWIVVFDITLRSSSAAVFAFIMHDRRYLILRYSSPGEGRGLWLLVVLR